MDRLIPALDLKRKGVLTRTWDKRPHGGGRLTRAVILVKGGSHPTMRHIERN